MTDYEFNMRDNEEEFEKEFVDDYSVVSPHEPPTLEDTSWDADSAEASLRRWAGGPDKDDINWTDYRKGFLYYDSGNIEQWGSYYFPHHKVQDGELVTSERGVITAGNYLQGARGFNPDQLPDEVLSRARSHLARHYAQFDRTPPWRETDEEEGSLQDEDTWTREEAESWLRDNDFKYTGTVAGLDIPEVTANWYAYRQEDPDKYDDFNRVSDPFGFDEGDGVHVNYGILEEDGEETTEVQSIYFYHGGGEDEEESENQRQCPECGAWIDDDTETCPECGTEIDELFEGRCPKCGSFLSNPKVDECPNCGEDVDPFEAINPIKLEKKGKTNIKIVKHWRQGELSNGEDEFLHYDIFFEDKHFHTNNNPLEKEVTLCSMRKPYKKNFINEIEDEYTFINKNEVGNIDSSDSWMKKLADEEGVLYEGKECYAILLDEKDETPILCIHEEESFNNEWIARFIDITECCEYTEIIDFSGKPVEFEMEFESKPVDVSFMDKDDDGNLVAEGNIISKGAWNGLYFSEDVVRDIDESELRDASIDVGKIDVPNAHEEKLEDVGELINLEWNDEEIAWRMEFKITDDEAIELVEQMDNPGLSIETRLMVNKVRRIVDRVKEISAIVTLENPACKVCYIE